MGEGGNYLNAFINFMAITTVYNTMTIVWCIQDRANMTAVSVAAKLRGQHRGQEFTPALSGNCVK